jgi:hypothetical protein
MNNKTAKDLTKEPPRSPHIKLGGYVILSRTIDKCRASIWGKLGEYEFDCELDNYLFGFKGIKGSDFRKFVEEGHSDEEILKWVNSNGIEKTQAEIDAWSAHEIENRYADDAEGSEWLQGRNKKLGIDLNSTLFQMLDMDDKVSFKK